MDIVLLFRKPLSFQATSVTKPNTGSSLQIMSSSFFTSGGDSTKRGKGLSAIPASKSSPALAASALMSKRCMTYLGSFLGVSIYSDPQTIDPLVSKEINTHIVSPKLQCLGTVHDKVFEDNVLRKMDLSVT